MHGSAHFQHDFITFLQGFALKWSDWIPVLIVVDVLHMAPCSKIKPIGLKLSVLPTLIVHQTSPGRIHQRGSLCLRHLGERSSARSAPLPVVFGRIESCMSIQD